MLRTLARREFLRTAATWTLATPWLAHATAAERVKLPVAAVVTVYRKGSHADVIVGKILEGWQQDGGPGPDLSLAALYVDQIGKGDLSRPLAEKHGFRLAQSIDEAITLGTDRVQVAGVLSIGEHGDYPFTPETKQHIYPRRRFFEEIAAALHRGGRVVPVFNDKHLAHSWSDAKAMYDLAHTRKIPFLAGSSVPVAWRLPALELERGTELTEALTIGYSSFEAYGFHAIEAHQAMLERRRGGETGIVAVQAVRGAAIHQAAAEKRWSPELLQAALNTLPGQPQARADWTEQENAALYLLEHRDGLKSAVAMVGRLAPQFAFAGRVRNQAAPVATWFRLQEQAPHGHFAYLLQAIEETIHSGRAVYPVERTLLTTGTLDRVMHSLADGGRRLETPELAIAYQPADWPFANHPRTRLQLPVPQDKP